MLANNYQWVYEYFRILGTQFYGGVKRWQTKLIILSGCYDTMDNFEGVSIVSKLFKSSSKKQGGKYIYVHMNKIIIFNIPPYGRVTKGPLDERTIKNLILY